MNTNHTYNRTQITMTDNTTYRLGSAYRSQENLKNNHEVKVSINGTKYIVNNANGFCYVAI
jgi:hypothetical protein